MILLFERYGKLSVMLLMAASFTSNSLSLRSRVNVWIRLLSVISLPKASENLAKFLANARRTYQDLSSPAASKVPRVWI